MAATAATLPTPLDYQPPLSQLMFLGDHTRGAELNKQALSNMCWQFRYPVESQLILYVL